MRLDYLDLHTTDPYYNLACEQYVFDELPRDRSYLMLWQNDNTVVIGRYQNTYAQINADFVRSHGVRVARRLSGGGAVYHDMGNLNYTFISDSGEIDRLNMHIFCEPVVRALEKAGVKAEINGRNDITIDGKKFSGNSQYVKNGRVMHHGTILFDSDLSVVGEALRVNKEKIAAKGIDSVRSRVTNVRPCLSRDMTLSDFRALLLREMTAGAEGGEYCLTEGDRVKIKALRERYASWEWNYGRSPACTMQSSRRFEGCGTVELYVTAENGSISDMQLCGDFFALTDPEGLAERFVGLDLKKEELERVLNGTEPSKYINGLTADQLRSLLFSLPLPN